MGAGQKCEEMAGLFPPQHSTKLQRVACTPPGHSTTRASHAPGHRTQPSRNPWQAPPSEEGVAGCVRRKGVQRDTQDCKAGTTTTTPPPFFPCLSSSLGKETANNTHAHLGHHGSDFGLVHQVAQLLQNLGGGPHLGTTMAQGRTNGGGGVCVWVRDGGTRTHEGWRVRGCEMRVHVTDVTQAK